MNEEEAIKELRNSYELHQCEWAKRCLDVIQTESEKKDKIIGKMIDNIMTHYQVKTIRKMCCPTCKIGEKACTYSGIHRNCIKRYFEYKVEEDK